MKLRRHRAPVELDEIDEKQRRHLNELVTLPSMIPGYPMVDDAGMPIQVTRFESMKCEHCGGLHVGQCPRIKRIEYTDSGGVRAVVYRETWDDSAVIFGTQLVEQDPSATSV